MSARAWIALGVVLGIATSSAGFERSEQRASCADRHPLRAAYFGDLHVHTALSFDAAQQGTRNTPRDAYRFARGEAVGVQPYGDDGQPLRTVRLRRPLDFAAVTDHAELLGETRICADPALPGHDAFVCRLTRRWPWLAYMLVSSQMIDVAVPRRYSFCGADGGACREAALRPWRETQHAAEEAYDRSAACRFTSFVGYEWSGDPDGNMVHRNVIFRNATVPALPSSYVEDLTAPRLWQRLREECTEATTGCDAVVIPHNANLSGGLLFAPPADREDAATRAALEVLFEVTQHKGDSECRAGVGLTDEECGFETLDFARMRESAMSWEASEPPPMSYAREVLAAGLAHEERLGVNPFRVGFVGSTDTHLGTPGLVDEDQFVGHAAGMVTSRLEIPPMPDDVRLNPGGLAVVWAEENSRDALFAAMRRRETYATSGPRLSVRFFGGWDYADDLCAAPDLAGRGYAGGAPMGGELPARAGEAPAFAVWAAADPGTADHPGTPLERLQIVKLWTEGDAPRQRVFDVAGERVAGERVDLSSCRPPAEGARELCAVWRDPEFDANRPALYYARVLEQPSCRWTTWQCLRARVDCADGAPRGMEACCDPAVPKTIRERATTSPIWYRPAVEPAAPVEVYLIIVDGLGADAATRERMPRLAAAAARARGSWLTAVAVMPTRTNPNHASLLTGVYAGAHGVTGNWYGTGAEERELDQPQLLEVETLFTALARQRPEARTVAAFAKGKLRRLFAATTAQRAPDAAWQPERPEAYSARDGETMEGFRSLVGTRQPALGVVAIVDVDRAGHVEGPRSVSYAAAVTTADAWIGRLLDDLERAGRWERSVVIVTADHGFDALHPGPAGRIDVAAFAQPGVQLVSDGGVAHVYGRGGRSSGDEALRAVSELARGHGGVAAVYAREPGLGVPLMPEDWRLDHPRTGDLVARPGVTFVGGASDPTWAFRGNHGGPGERLVPLVVVGGHPALRRAPVALRPSIADVAPTVAALLNVEAPRRLDGGVVPAALRGRVLREILGGE